jgi:hypothetical protein
MMGRLTFVTFVVAAAGALAASQAGQTVDVNAIGPKVGERAIAFQLPDQQSRPRTLASVAGPRGTMLVFFRSADW